MRDFCGIAACGSFEEKAKGNLEKQLREAKVRAGPKRFSLGILDVGFLSQTFQLCGLGLVALPL